MWGCEGGCEGICGYWGAYAPKNVLLRFYGSWYLKWPTCAHGFNSKISFEKYASDHWPKYPKLWWLVEFWYTLVNVDFYNPIFALKPWAQALRFVYTMNTIHKMKKKLIMKGDVSIVQIWKIQFLNFQGFFLTLW